VVGWLVNKVIFGKFTWSKALPLSIGERKDERKVMLARELGGWKVGETSFSPFPIPSSTINEDGWESCSFIGDNTSPISFPMARDERFICNIIVKDGGEI
jgi:hypothetical protein